MGVLLILLDAFSYDYIRPDVTPFLTEMANEGILKPLAPMFAFRGIEATLFSGKWPPVHNIWTEFRLRTKRRSRIGSKILAPALDLLDKVNHERLSKLARLMVTITSNHRVVRLTPGMIPGDLLLSFEPSMKKQIWRPNALTISTIFDWLRTKNKGYICMERIPPFQDDYTTVSRFKQAILKESPSLAWIKLNSLDSAGHTFGPEVLLLRETLSQTDNLVEEIVRWGKKAGLNDVMVISDHGMSPVRNWRNLTPLLDQLDKDVLYFLDSTMARFWFQKKNQKDKVINLLKSVSYGKILSLDEMQSLKMPIDPRYGELVFALEEGDVFCPDFWNGNEKVKGMHGYAYSNSLSATPFLLCNKKMTSLSTEKEDYFEFTDIMPWIIRALENSDS